MCITTSDHQVKLPFFFCWLQVVRKLCLGLQMENGTNNRFALFEVKAGTSIVIDDRTILVDILGKFEM